MVSGFGAGMWMASFMFTGMKTWVVKHQGNNNHTMYCGNFHYVDEQIFDDSVVVKWIDTTQQNANILTKALGDDMFGQFGGLLGMVLGVQA